ncbi:hypothetical protein [Hydrogenophaga electricum]|uniref:Uncharacterized protein n=1 Tax=Hydrogenophaga electricum TaxID=1230953 RepID=A0ABQ6C6G0_9BURK|nr:hypothetical protein [Hydrogenophaga electricum]GLS15699.1 hypothetical protein GCM10007935_31350 [Hydrogenophaga electricum]
MAFPQPDYLTEEQIHTLLSRYDAAFELTMTRIRYKNKQEIRRPETITARALLELIVESIDSGWGFDMDVDLPQTGQTLMGHHDGIYWLK